MCQEQFFDVALVDMKFPDLEGIEVLRTFREKHPTMMNTMITGHATLQSAVEVLNLGAYAYIMKSIHLDKLSKMIKKSLLHARSLLL